MYNIIIIIDCCRYLLTVLRMELLQNVCVIQLQRGRTHVQRAEFGRKTGSSTNSSDGRRRAETGR